MLRANANGFDPVLQFTDRAATLAMNGHPVDKIELLVLGGTWASYPLEYQEEFCRDCECTRPRREGRRTDEKKVYYAANTFYQRQKRPRLSLMQEQKINESTTCKIIGLTLETRPDCINAEELRQFRRYGCTRVQLGVQHTDDAVLRKINRGHGRAEAARAVQLLKDACYKIDIHLMPNLPGSSRKMDLRMFNDVLYSKDLHVDQWKIYPCEVVPWTVIKKWFDEGSYVPYSDEELIDVLTRVKAKVHPWIRLNRVVRDIPSQYILGGINAPSLRQDLAGIMAHMGLKCRCIRCREVGTRREAIAASRLTVRRYATAGGTEYFISFETPDRSIICGFCRLRISQHPGAGVFEELEGCALVRELHVYGSLVKSNDKVTKAAQHVGFGRQMMDKAEALAAWHGFRRVAVIAGVGTRNYYAKLGYELEGEGAFMIKDLPPRRTGRLATALVYCLCLLAALLAAALLAGQAAGGGRLPRPWRAAVEL